MNNELLTTAEATRLLRIDRHTLYRWAKDRDVPSIIIGSKRARRVRRRYHKATILALTNRVA